MNATPPAASLVDGPAFSGLRPAAREDRLIGWGLFGAAFIALLMTERAVGFVRDETQYFYAASSYARWLQLLLSHPAAALEDGTIVGAFDVNHEHPVLMKTLFGVSYLVFHEWLGVLRPAAAFRVPAFAATASIPFLLFHFGRAMFGRGAGLFAAVAFLVVPRQFFHGHLACFDMPITTLWLLTVYLFWRAQAEPRYWLWCGVALGLSLATKHNALFLPLILGPFALAKAWYESRASARARSLFWQFVALYAAVAFFLGGLALIWGGETFQARLEPLSPAVALFVTMAVGSALLLRKLAPVSPATFRPLATIASMGVLGPGLFYLLWPYLWHHPVSRTAWYLAFHAQHNHYTWFYLGKLLREPPFPLEYVVVVTALTVPLSLFVPMVTGLIALAGRGILTWGKRTADWVSRPSFGEALVGVNSLASILIISHPDVPHFGGVKHWFPAMPFLALLSGWAVARAAKTLDGGLRAWRPSLPRWATAAGLFALLLLPALIATARIIPYGTSYYSESAGGLPGAASLGMQRQFWSNNVTGVLDWLNQNAPRGSRLWLHESISFGDYQRNGMLRSDLIPAGGPADANFAVYQYHQEFREQEYNIWQLYGTQKPVAGLYLDETPQVVVYRRP